MKRLLKQVVNLEVEKYQSIIDQESFAYIHCKNIKATSFIHAIDITGHENDFIF